jgi:hypothetical protein
MKAMARKHDIQRVIRRPFSVKEWETLMKNPEFAGAFERVETTDEAEGLMTLGARMLDRTTKELARPSSRKLKRS